MAVNSWEGLVSLQHDIRAQDNETMCDDDSED